jgi:predicted permease
MRSLFNRSRVEDELNDELRFHLEQQIAENLAQGMEPELARRRATAIFGAQHKIEDECREKRRIGFVDHLRQDLRFTARILARSPGFSSAAVVTLALGIGANAAIFTLINAVMLRTLPVQNPGQLVLLSDSPSSGAITGDPPGLWWEISYPAYIYLRDHNTRETTGILDGLSAVQFGNFRATVRLEQSDSVSMATAQVVSGNYFSVLGVNPHTGRSLEPADDRPGAEPVAVVSYAYWDRKLGRDPSAIGRSVELNDTPVTIVGVAPSEFFGERVTIPPDYWLPISSQPQVSRLGGSFLEANDRFWLNLIGRLTPGSTLDQAQAVLNTQLRQFILDQYGSRYSVERKNDLEKQHLKLVPGARGISMLRQLYSTPLQVLMGMVAILLLIACVNVANLLLSRAMARQQEICMRLALGAPRSRLVQQLLTESLVIAALGGALGLALALWSVRLLASLVTSSGTPLNLGLDLRLLGFTLGACLLTAMISGVIPALRATRPDLIKVLAASTPRASRRSLLSKALIVGQVAMSLMLVISAGLFTRTLGKLESQDLGFRRDSLLLVKFDARVAGYKPEQLPPLYRRLLDRVGALPGVRSATLAYYSPLSGSSSTSGLNIEGFTPPKGQNMSVETVPVGPAYFETLGIPILAGRGITAQDADGPLVAVINQTTAKTFFPDSDPIGRKIFFSSVSKPGDYIEIVGVVGDAKFDNLRDQPSSMVFTPAFQRQGTSLPYVREVELRTAADPRLLAAGVREAIAQVDPHLPVTQTGTIDDNINSKTAETRIIARLSVAFGLIALVLASIGIYGVIAHDVAARTREIGIRMAIGASAPAVFNSVIGRALGLALIGTVIGFLAATGLTRTISTMLFGIGGLDPLTYTVAPLIIIVTALAAGFIPARRAVRVDPVVALRYE